MSDSTASNSSDELTPLKQASYTIDSDDEDASNNHILRKLNDWPRTPPQVLDDAQLAKLFDAIIKYSFRSPPADPAWTAKAQSNKFEGHALERAITVEPTLKRWLQRCWKTGDFTIIRGAAFLCKEPPIKRVPTNNNMGATVDNSKLINKALDMAWKVPYQGDDHRDLYEMVCAMKTEGDTKDYSNTASIIQSSGCGKSRMVDEQADLVFTIPVNLRGANESMQLAYPPPDTAVRHALILPLQDEAHQRLRYHTFFLWLFASTRKVVDGMIKETPTITYDELSHRWRMYLWPNSAEGKTQSCRDEFYGVVVRDVEIEEASLKREVLREARAGISGETMSETENALSNAAISLAALPYAEKRAGIELDNLLKSLETVRDPTRPNRSVKLVVYFDEAHELTKTEVTKSYPAITLYDVLFSVLNEHVTKPFFVLFLSTSFNIARFAPPPTPIFGSARAFQSDAHHAPITETPFDCYPKLLIEPDIYTLRDVSSISFMAKFGRPLFWTMLHNSTGDDLTKLTKNIVELARRKLLGPIVDINARPESFGGTARLAIIDVRLCLAYDPLNTRLVFDKTAELVAHHMRLAYSVPKHGVYFRSGYSSEPVLAEAATVQLNAWRKSNSAVMVDVLNHHMRSGLLDRSERREVVARALITEAYDRATLRCHKDVGPPLSSGCGAIEFIEELYRDHGTITEAHPDNVSGGVPFREAFKHARLRITHWVRAEDNHGLDLSTESMAAAFIRGCAFICRHGESFVDLVVPLLLWDEKIGESVMSAIFLQVKLRRDKRSYHINAGDLGFFRRSDSGANPFMKRAAKRPYITIVMDLGSRNSLHEYNRFPAENSDIDQKATGPMKKANVSRTKSAPQITHPRYAIFATGCSDTVYAVVHRDHRTKWQHLLQQGNLLGDHPRPRSIPSVRNMKPFWSFGPESYSWYKSAVLNRTVHEPGSGEEDEGMLYVRTYQEIDDDTSGVSGRESGWETEEN